MSATGGSYMSMPISNSEAVARGMYLPHNPLSSHSHAQQRELYPPYATDYNYHRPKVTPAVSTKVTQSPWKPNGYTRSKSPPHNGSVFQTIGDTEVSKRAPFSSRLRESYIDSALGYPRLDFGKSGNIPRYHALNDPHLYNYFTHKFANPAPPSGPGTKQNPPSRPGCTIKRPAREVVYKIALTTGNRANAGTDARVFIRLKGNKGKLPKKHLAKKSASNQSKKKSHFRFTKGSTHIFKVKGPDIGDLKSLSIEHDGLTKKSGWFLEQIEVVNTVTKKSWLFVCQQWLSLHEGDCQISRELYAKQYSKTEYEIVAVTGNMKGAGTDANVSITLFGKTGTTPKLQLKNNSRNCFERNQSDIFLKKTTCVGPMTKVRIEHDNTGFGAGWFLDRIVVTDLKNPKWKYYFPCGTWLAKDEGDRLICRDLVGSKDPLAIRKACKYKVTVYTGNKRGAGTDANVYMTMFGESGESGEMKLDNSKNNFEKGQVDEFMLECPRLGPLKRIRIGHDNWGPTAGWYLDKLIIDDMEMNTVYEFPCDRWLAKDEDDGAISRDLLCNVGPMDAPPGVPYSIHVTTGDMRHASTSARVYVVLYGGKKGKENSGKVWLEGGKFDRGKTDVFNVEVNSMLSPLTKIDIGHDNSGTGPGWFLDKVMVKCPSAGMEQWFICDKWLATDEGDGVIERTLQESRGMRKEKKKLNTWYAWVKTSEKSGAGTDANVWMVLYGKNKNGDSLKSDEIPLDNKGDNFEAGDTDNFKIEVDEIGKPYKLRIGHDNSGSFAGWHLDQVELENMATKKRYIFHCGRWLAKDEDDGSIIREMPAEGETIRRPEPLIQYAVEVHTGKKRGAGTDANVFLNIFGDQGDTGERPLEKSRTHTNKFEKGNVDEFVVEAVDLKRLKRIRIGHDGKNSGDGWFLDKVIVKPLDNSQDATVFECNRWLATDEDDGLIVREITAGGSQMLNTTSYHVSVKTGDVRGAGTDANVFIKIFGSKGDTSKLQLKSADNTKNKFERGRTDLFKLEAADIGKIEKIRIGHDSANIGSGWFLDEVRLDIPSKGEHYIFACHRWLDKSEGDGETEVELDPTHVQKGQARMPYEVTVWTGSIRGAGTDANVFIQMYGEYGKTEEHQLRNRTDNFEQGEMDKFKIEAADIGPINKIRIGHDGTGMFAGWFLDKVLIQRPVAKGAKRRRTRRKPSIKSISRSMAASESEGEEDPRYARRKKSAPNVSRFGDDSDDERLSKYSLRLKNLRKRRQDLEDDEDDRSSPRSRKKKGAYRYRDEGSEESDTGPRSPKSKRSLSQSGRFRQDDDSDDSRYSRKSGKKKSFLRRFASDEEDSADERQGRRQKMKKSAKERAKERSKERSEIKDDDEVEVEDYWFVCNKWFARSEDDGKIIRELVPTDENGNPLDTGLQEIEYDVSVYTGDVWGAGTDANVFVNISGQYGDTGDRPLKDSDKMNKFERDQVDIFKIKAVELGRLKKVKVRHDNKGGGAAWFLGHIEIRDPKTKEKYFFPCQRWLAVNEDDGQIARELVPVDEGLKRKLSAKDSKAVRDQVALETKAAMTTYHVYVHTGDKWGAGTDANVYLILFGEVDDTGTVFLKSSKNHKNKFERNQMDEFVVEAVDIGDLRKIKIGHDNAGGGGAWYLDRVEIDCPSLGKKWVFVCGRWLAKDEDDGQLERELYPQDMATEEYIPCVPYEVTTYTSDTSGASTDADVYIVLYGRDTCTQQKSLCTNKRERKKCFGRGAVDKFVVEMEDVGETIEKIRIGHDGSGWGAGWHLDKVEVRRLKETGRDNALGSETYTFQCKRWLARDEEDGAIVRELVADRVIQETTRKDGSIKKKEVNRRDTLIAKKYTVNVHTGDVKSAGTDANVYLTIYGDKGDTGERKLHKSETNRDKFERGQVDVFLMEAVDLGKVFKIRIRHDNSMFGPSWFLDKVEVVDTVDKDTYTFHCERWLAKNKDDGKIDRVLYVKGYEGDMSSTSTLRSARVSGSVASLDSLRSTDPFSKSPRMNRRQLEEIPEGPSIPYTVKVTTGDGNDNGTEANVWIKIMGPKKRHTGRLFLELAQRARFDPSSIETFSLEAVDVEEVRQIELGHDGVTPGTGWFVKEVEIDMPTKGKHYFFTCKQWLARDKGDGKTSRLFTLKDGDSSTLSYKPLVPYETTVHTGDVQHAGTDAPIFLQVFGDKGTSSEVKLDKAGDRFERGRSDLVKMELEDVAPLKKLRIGHTGKGARPEWFLEKVEMRNMDTGNLYVFTANTWFSKSRGDGKIVRDLVATIRGKDQLKATTYKIFVKTSDVRGAGTNANVYITLFGEHGDSGEIHLKESETNKDPFENNQVDVFTFQDILSLGQLMKVRIWHDNKGLGAAWHCSQVEVEDCNKGRRYVFPCNRWLSKSEDDKQICRELSCANLPSPSSKDKISYDIEVTTADKKDAGMMHNAWVIVEGEERTSKEFIMENSARNKILRRGQTDRFTMVSRNLGRLTRCIVGAVERDDKSLGNVEGRDSMWYCHEVVVTDNGTGDKYVFPCKNWVNITRNISKKHAKALEVKKVEEGKLSAVRNLAPVKYEVVVVTGDVRGAGTDANVSITIYGANGDTGQRALTQKFRDLFERNQTDKFIVEALDLGELAKVKIEHDNSGWGAAWLLDRVEITNMASSHTWVFPCGKWLDKKKGDGEISRELFARD